MPFSYRSFRQVILDARQAAQSSVPPKTAQCFRNGRWQVMELVRLSEQLEREIATIENAVNASGTAIGNEHNRYSTAERIRHIIVQRDYFMRECDRERASHGGSRLSLPVGQLK